jgi:hypothetical protein
MGRTCVPALFVLTNLQMEMLARSLLILAFVCGTKAADFKVKTADSLSPKEISESIRATLQKKAVQLLEAEKPVVEIWLRQDVPVKSKPATLDSLAETTLIGAVAVHGKGLRDYKDNDVPTGIFTARFGLQPQDGDHLGTAEFSYFLVLIGADADKELTGLDKFRPMVKASGKLTPSGHPLIISLRPVSGSSGEVPEITQPASEHRALRLKLPGSDLVFDLVFEGHGHIQ